MKIMSEIIRCIILTFELVFKILNMKRTLLFFTFLITNIFFKAQSDFKLATELKDGTEWFIKEEGDYKAWVKVIIKSKKVKSKKTGKLINSGGGEYVEYWICSCKDKKYNTESGIEYDSSGNPIGNISETYNERVIPDTVGEKILNIICGHDEYLEDIRQKQYEALVRPTNEELYNTINRRNTYIDGFKVGYKTVYCAPYSDCFIKDYELEEIIFADDPYLDFDKGYQEGKAKAESDKKKKQFHFIDN